MGNSKDIIPTKTKTVTTEQGDVIVNKLALRDYADLFRALDKLPKHLAQIFKADKENLDSSYIIQNLLTIAGDSLEELAGVLSVATNKEKEFLLQLDLADTADILVAVLELNDYQRIFAAIKKIQALRKPQGDQSAA